MKRIREAVCYVLAGFCLAVWIASILIGCAIATPVRWIIERDLKKEEEK